MKDLDQQQAVKATMTWLVDVVIGENLCPFAREPLESSKLEIVSCSEHELMAVLGQSLENINNSIYETALVVLNNDVDFKNFYELFCDIEFAFEQNELDQTFQLVAFHPDFVFEGLDQDDLANLVNRSPLPTIHILKRESFDNLNLTETSGEDISKANEERLKSKSPEQLKQLFPWQRF
ncbi:MAG: DUF1415 family protein [Bacteriovoracaceae bacterium]|nr:DUF1415 family protein [Bacteriovoracaceae bacterium]